MTFTETEKNGDDFNVGTNRVATAFLSELDEAGHRFILVVKDSNEANIEKARKIVPKGKRHECRYSSPHFHAQMFPK